MPTDLRHILQSCPVVAVLGAHDAPERAAFYVPEYLHHHGYRVLPVNPRLVGRTLWGQPVRARLTELTEPVDLVDVFRAPEALMGHLDELLAMRPLPRVVWLQLGIRHDAFARQLEQAGIEVVQSRCTLADHRALGLGSPQAVPPRSPQERP